MEKELFEVIGSFGRWQMMIYSIFFYSNIVGIWQNYAMTFQAPNVPFRCIEPSINTSTRFDEQWPNDCTVHPLNSTEEVPCTLWEYDIERYSNTVVSEWDLVCDREWLISFSKSVYMIGFMMSMFIFGQVSDLIGRRPTILIAYIIALSSVFLSLFSKSMETFLIFRFFQAFGRTGFTINGFVLIMEIVGPLHRFSVGITIQLGWSCGLALMVILGYFFKNWFWFQVAIAVPMLPLAVVFILVPESPRWLLMHGKTEQLKELIIYASKKNKIELKEDANEIVKKLMEGRTVERKGILLDLFRTSKMRYRTLIMMYLWLVNSALYYTMSYNTNDLFGDPYINFLVLAILEFPATGLIYLAQWYGRRLTTAVLMLLSGACCMSLLAVPNDIPWMSTILSQAGKFCITASFGLVYLYAGELFPTVIRSAAMGSCSTAARVGSIIAPFSKELAKATYVSVPNIIISILATSSGIFAFWLPETTGQKLPDTLDEGENAFEMKPEKKPVTDPQK